MEPFSELSEEQWPELQKRLKQLWPHNMISYYALQMNGKCRQLRDLFQFKVFVPYGDMDNGCIMTRQPIQDGSYCAFNVNSITKDYSKLIEALKKTKLIDWTPCTEIDFIPSCLNRVVANLLSSLPQTYECRSHSLTLYYKDSKETPFLDVRCPSNTYVAPVRTDHIQRINDVWRHKFPGSDLFFTTLASCNLGYGLFSCNNHELLAWLFIGDYWHLCHLYCEEEHRGKGYGSYLMKYVSNEILRSGNDVFGMVLKGNNTSAALFEKLGYKVGDETCLLKIEQKQKKFH